jgi:Phosphatidylinositol 3- and 4-kinase
MDVLGLLPGATNDTFLARVTGDGREALAVYKPETGEAPLWDFPHGTLGRREVAAYATADALGWPRIPPTVLRNGPEGPGSVQQFVEFHPEEHYFTLSERFPDEFRGVALFDAVVNNADRKAGHCLLATDGSLFFVDHGLCFHEDPKLRTVIWEFAGEPVPERLLADLRSLRAKLATPPLRDEMPKLLSVREVSSLVERLDRLVHEGRFPEPGPHRSFPWPPV